MRAVPPEAQNVRPFAFIEVGHYLTAILPYLRVVFFSRIGVDDEWNGVVRPVVVDALEEIRHVGRRAAVHAHRYQLVGIRFPAFFCYFLETFTVCYTLVVL